MATYVIIWLTIAFCTLGQSKDQVHLTWQLACNGPVSPGMFGAEFDWQIAIIKIETSRKFIFLF